MTLRSNGRIGNTAAACAGSLALLALLVALAYAWTNRTAAAAPASKRSKKEVEEPKLPLEMRGFVLHVTRGGTVTEKITAETARLYEQHDIAHLLRVHVDFYKDEARKEKDTLDAPEGYLYLKDLVLDEEHPFYDRIGGENAITTPTFFSGGKAKTVPRGREDIDLIGRLGRKVVYRRIDGTEVRSIRALRHARDGRLYGIRQCEMRRPRPKTKDVMVITGGAFTLDETLTSGIRVLDRGGEVTRMYVEPLKSPANSGRQP